MSLHKFTEENQVLSSESQNLAKDIYMGTAEKTHEQSSWVRKSFYKPWNPDDLYQKTGDYSIYEDMALDDQVATCMQLKLDLIVGCGWRIVTSDDSQSEFADQIEDMLEQDPDENFDEIIEQFARNSYEKGFALSEKIFKQKENNILSLKNIKTRHPQSWMIHTDVHGNIEKYVQVGTKEGDIEVKKESLLHLINNPQYQNPYGTSDLRKCYEAWFAKRQFIRYFAIFLEKYASPIPYAKYPKNMPPDKVTDMFNVLKSFQQKTALCYPEGFEVQFLQSSTNGEAFSKAINLFNMFIGRALFVPDLLGFQGSETGGGSFSLGQDQIKVFMKHIYRRRKTLEGLINKHIIYPMYIWNFGQTETYPYFEFKPVDEENTDVYAKTFLEAVKSRLYKPSDEEINHFKSLIKFPETETIERFDDTPPMFPGMVNPAMDGGPNGGDEADKDAGDDKEEKEADEPEEKNEDVDKDAEKKEFAMSFPEEFGTYHKRVDFAAIKNSLNSAWDVLYADLKPTFKKIFNDLLEQVEKKKILGNPAKPERIEDIKVKYLKEMQTTFKANFRQHYKNSKKIAAIELGSQKFGPAFPSEKFLELLDAQTFGYVGQWEANVYKVLKPKLIAAIKDGLPLGSVLDEVEGALWDSSDVSVERWARTTSTEVMNQARYEEFESSGIVEAYQYSAILDGRTSDLCAALDGKIFPSAEAPIPPLHFNCRSLLIPITQFEDWKATNNKSVENLLDSSLGDEGNGFSRFIKKEAPIGN